MKTSLSEFVLSRERRACFAHARDVWLPECGHNIHHGRPEDAARLIEEFFPA